MNKCSLILFFILSTLISCTIYKEFPIDVYKPGETALPPDTRKIAIVSRNFKYYNDTLQHYFKSDFRLLKDKKNERLNIDSIAISKAMQGLATGLQTSGNFEKVELFPYNLIKPHQGEKLSAFGWDMVKSLTDPIDADILISLETLSYFFSSNNSTETVEPMSNEVVTAAVWGIYDPAGKKVIDRKQMIDTVYWNGYDEETLRSNYDLPPRLDAIKLACEIAGEDYAKRFTPSWQKVYRMYAIPPIEDFRIAAQYFEEGKWDNAINTWGIYAPEKFRKLAISARYNIALGYEMKDDIEKALHWIKGAVDLAVSLKSKEDLKMIGLYKAILTQRLAEYKKLNQ